jgi:hypothetical protein
MTATMLDDVEVDRVDIIRYEAPVQAARRDGPYR